MKTLVAQPITPAAFAPFGQAFSASSLGGGISANQGSAVRFDHCAKLLNTRPNLIWNNRLGGGYNGDTETPEQYIPAQGYPGRDWEACMTINDTWGYKVDDKNFKSTETLLHNLIDIASKGGNYLLNIGPDAMGNVPPDEVTRLEAMGKWMDVNGESIYATKVLAIALIASGIYLLNR